MRRATRLPLAIVGVLAAAAVARAADDYKPPADGKLTDKQVSAYLAVMKEQMDATRAAAKAADGATTDAAKTAVMTDMSRQVQAAVGHHGLSAGEYDWVKGQVDAAAPTALAQRQWEAVARPALEQQAKTARDQVKAAEAADDKAATDAARQQAAAVDSMLSAGPPVPDADPKPDPANVALVRAHLADYFAALGVPDPAAPKK